MSRSAKSESNGFSRLADLLQILHDKANEIWSEPDGTLRRRYQSGQPPTINVTELVDLQEQWNTAEAQARTVAPSKQLPFQEYDKCLIEAGEVWEWLANSARGFLGYELVYHMDGPDELHKLDTVVPRLQQMAMACGGSVDPGQGERAEATEAASESSGDASTTSDRTTEFLGGPGTTAPDPGQGERAEATEAVSETPGDASTDSDRTAETLGGPGTTAPEVGQGERAEATDAATVTTVNTASWLTVSDAARVTGANRGVISRAVNSGELKGQGKGSARRVCPADLTRWQLERSKKPLPQENDDTVRKKLLNLPD